MQNITKVKKLANNKTVLLTKVMVVNKVSNIRVKKI